jgi:deoxyribonuclease-4
MADLRIGAHVDGTDAGAAAAARKADLVQVFLGDPQSYKGPVVPEGLDQLAADGVDLYVHAPYPINVASTNNRIRIPGRKLLAQHAEAAAALGAKGLIVHGGHVTADEDPSMGFDNWRKTFERWTPPLPVLIENTAGGDRAMARTLDAVGRLWEALGDHLDGDGGAGRIGFCLDTCHAHAGGEALVGLVDRLRSLIGGVDLVHCNDSRDPFDSRRDRHDNLGRGQIPLEAIVEVVRTADAPVVCETPGGTDGQAADIALLREQL